MAFDLSTYRKDTRWAVGHGYGPVVTGGPARRTPAQIKAILIHTTNSPVGNTAYPIEAAFLRDSPDVSIHYVVSSHDDAIVQVLPEPWIAWHAGASADPAYNNPTSIGIEIAWCPQAGALPQQAIDNVTRLVQDIRTRLPWITKIDMHRAQAIPKGRKIDPSGWSDAAFYAWRERILKGPAMPQPSVTDDLYLGTGPRIRLDTFQAVLRDHGSPIPADHAADTYALLVKREINAARWLAHCSIESDFGKAAQAMQTANVLNLRARPGDPAVNGFWNYNGAWYLGNEASIIHLKHLYGQYNKLTWRDIGSLWARETPTWDAAPYLAKGDAAYLDILKREA